jgi:uncharacterized protein DUF4232
VSPARFASCFGCTDCVITATLLETSCETIWIFDSNSLQAAMSSTDVKGFGAGAVVVPAEVAVVGGAAVLPPPQPARASASSTSTAKRHIAPSVAAYSAGVRASIRIVLVSLLLALAAGCSSSSKKAETEGLGPAVPWTPKQPSQVAARTPAPTACAAADLKVQGQVTFVPMLQGGIALVTLRNTGTRTCRLAGRPRVRFVKNGGPAQVQRRIPPTPSNFPETTYPASALLALRPGETGALTITWDNWCDPVIAGKPHLPPSAVRITLPAGRGSIDADYNAVPTCLDPSKPTTIGVSVFQPSLIPRTRAWSGAFLRAEIPNQPLRVRRGGILHFHVVLANASRTTARFGRCPAYVQQLAPSGGVEVYDLNCSAAHPIAFGKRLVFAMQIRVPNDSPLGGNGLFWALDPFGARGPQAHARVTVDR